MSKTVLAFVLGLTLVSTGCSFSWGDAQRDLEVAASWLSHGMGQSSRG